MTHSALFMLGAFALQACGSASVDADDAEAQDATFENAGDECAVPFLCFDAQPNDASAQQATCPDASYFITINGDETSQTLSSGPSGVPAAFYFDCCGYTAISVVASANVDGGASIQFQQPATENADGGVTLSPGANIASYFRGNGMVFSSHADASAISFTQIDPPGGVVAGYYAVDVATSAQTDAGALSLSGTFLTCRRDAVTCECPPKP